MYKHWLIFTQSITVLLAIFFIVSSLRPDLLSWRPRGEIVVIRESTPTPSNDRTDSYAKAAEVAMPSVVNIFTSKEIKEPIPCSMIPHYENSLAIHQNHAHAVEQTWVLGLLSAPMVIF